MNNDISRIIQEWPFDPAMVSARWVDGADGRSLVQLRVDLGVYQMESEGRPDGRSPHGYSSFLSYYEHLERKKNNDGDELELDEKQCVDLQQEAVQFYHRYLAFYALHYYDGVIRDTEHSLRIFDLVSRSAECDEVVWQFMQFYPYVRMMNARARAEKAIERKDYDLAIKVLQETLKDIRDFWAEEAEDATQPSPEEEALQTMLEGLRGKLPRSQEDRLLEVLNVAIKNENYEKAAVVRDQLNQIRAATRKADSRSPDSH